MSFFTLKKPKGVNYIWYHTSLIVLIFVYILFVINPELIYYRNTFLLKANNFQYSGDFFLQLFSQPGGPGKYLTSFIVQFFYYPVLGAILITLISVLLYYFSNIILKQITGAKSFIFSVFPAVVPVLLYYNYSYKIDGLIGIAIAMAFVIFYISSRKKNFIVQSIIFSILFLILYYLVLHACLFFAIIVIFKEITKHKKFLILLVAGINILILNYIALWLFDSIILHEIKLIFSEGLVQGFIPYYILLYFILALSYVIFLNNYQKKSQISNQLGIAEKLAVLAKNKTTINATAIILCVIVGFNLLYNFDREKRTHLKIIKYTQHNQWNKIIEEVNKIPLEKQTVFLQNDIIRALYHTGELGSKMFHNIQELSLGIEPLLLYENSKAFSSMNMYRTLNTLMDLGEINLAEKIAFELMENIDITPNVLYDIALIQLVKSEPKSAKVFLNHLKSIPHLNTEMKELIQNYKNGNDLEELDEVQRLKSLQHNDDLIYYTKNINTKSILYNLYDNVPENKMAFEYIMAGCLLELQLEEIVINTSKYKQFGYVKLPEHIEEALVLFMHENQFEIPEIGGYKISRETKDRFSKFINIHYENRHDMKKAESVLFKEFGNTFFFYYAFGYSGNLN